MTRDQIQTVLDALTTVDSCVGLKNYFHDKPDGTDVRLDQVVDDAIAILQAALAEPSEPVIPFDLQQAHYAAIDRAVENVKRDMKVRDVTMRCKDYDILLPIIDTYAGHILVGPATHPASSKPEPDKDLIQALTERDEYHDMADKLAEGIALHFDGDIGEHSSSNSPWDRALDLLDSAACAETMRLSKPSQPHCLS